MRNGVRIRAALAGVLLTCFILGVSAASAGAATTPGKWSRATVSAIVHRGTPTTTTITFTATKAVKNVKFSVSGTGKALVKVSPSTLPRLAKGKSQVVTLTFDATVITPLKTFTATISAKSGRKTVAKAVKCTIMVREALPGFTPGTADTLATGNVGPTGGIITVPDGQTPISGVRVTVPAGALPESVSVSVGYDDGTLVPRLGEYAGGVMSLEFGGIHEFDLPVSITVPWPDTSRIPCPYYVDDLGLLHPAQLVSLDASAHTFTFETFHASWYTWIWQELADLLGIGTVDTGYAPASDGFQIVNTGSEYNRGGECFGMTSYSLWYFLTHKADGNFYPRFMDILGYSSDGTEEIRGQNIIATRSFISISKQWNTYYRNLAFVQQGALSQEARYAAIVNAIENTDAPVLIYLAHTNASGAHSVLAYAYNTNSGTISIYDPNKPGEVKSISYDLGAKTFSPYSGYDFITYSGDGSLHVTEAYQNIYDDALANFQGTNKATIQISSPTGDPPTTTERTTTISGTIESGQVLVTKLKIFVGTTPYEVDVPESGDFSVPVSLEIGDNHVKFETRGTMVNGALRDLPNNYDLQDYVIRCEAPQSIMLVTLTWNTPDTDIELYVTDPTGATSWYSSKTTPSGGVLDYDVLYGWGPEHFTLMNTNTIQYNQPYRVRVHYYSDHAEGTVPTVCTISILVYEGTNRAQTTWYTRTLSVENAGNSSPGSTGPDWADVANITLTQGP